MNEWIHEGPAPLGSVVRAWMANGSVRIVSHGPEGWRYSDCTHPQQNVICEPEDIKAWQLLQNAPTQPDMPALPPIGAHDSLVGDVLTWLGC